VFEQHVEDNEEEDLYDEDGALSVGTLKPRDVCSPANVCQDGLPENPWIARRVGDDRTLGAVPPRCARLRVPAEVALSPHYAAWTRISDVRGTLNIDGILTRPQLEVLVARHDATVVPDLYGTELYIGTPTSGQLEAIQQDLDNLFLAKVGPMRFRSRLVLTSL
jgi:hypothetical protein